MVLSDESRWDNAFLMRELRVVLGLAFVLLPWGTAAADPGSPQREGSDPEPGEIVHHVDEVSVTFNETLDPTSSRLRVHACGKRVDSGEMQFSPTGETISVSLDESPPGSYEATYRVRGLDDTPEERADPSEGSFSFALHYKRCEKDNGTGHGHGNGGNNKDHNKGGHDRGGHSGGDHTGDHAGGGGEHEGGHTTSSVSHGDHAGGSGHSGGHRGGKGDQHEDKGGGGHQKGDHSGHGDKGAKGEHMGHRPDPKDPDAGAGGEPSRPNDVLNLVLALGLPALVGALGGRALRARTISPAR